MCIIFSWLCWNSYLYRRRFNRTKQYTQTYEYLSIRKFWILIIFRLNSNQITILNRKQEIKEYQIKLLIYNPLYSHKTYDKKPLKILKYSVEKEEAKWKQNSYLDSHDTGSRVSQTTLEHAALPEVSLAINEHRAETFISRRFAKRIENRFYQSIERNIHTQSNQRTTTRKMGDKRKKRKKKFDMKSSKWKWKGTKGWNILFLAGSENWGMGEIDRMSRNVGIHA